MCLFVHFSKRKDNPTFEGLQSLKRIRRSIGGVSSGIIHEVLISLLILIKFFYFIVRDFTFGRYTISNLYDITYIND